MRIQQVFYLRRFVRAADAKRWTPSFIQVITLPYPNKMLSSFREAAS